MSRRRTVVVAPGALTEVETIDPSQYVGDDARFGPGALTVLNLCDVSRYLSEGYYVSLLADARGHEVVPSIDTLEALVNVPEALRVLEEAGVPTLRDPARLAALGDAKRAELSSVFGRCDRRELARLAAKIYRRLPVPVCELSFVHVDGGWRLYDLRARGLLDLDEVTRAQLSERIRSGRLETRSAAAGPVRTSLAVLYDPTEPFKPSYDEALARLEKVGERMGVSVRRIGPDDLERVAEHDALFIRCLTGPHLASFRFAQRAEALGIPVIDDTRSILRCGNKVYLAELLERAGIPTPQSVRVVRATTYDEVTSAVGSPFVLKVPDGSFSTAVFKIPSPEVWEERVTDLLKSSPILIAQEYLPSPFDWRIGVLDGKPLFAAMYFMVPGHWQIRRSASSGTAARDGRVRAVPLEQVPAAVKRIACAAARLIGDGMYGLDMKETPSGPVVIEVNDNPDLNRDYEDSAEGERIYEDILGWFVKRVEQESVTAPSEPPAPDDPTRPRIGGSRPITRDYHAYQVVGVEVEYAIVDEELRVVHAAEEALSALAGRATSEAELGAVAFSNEFFDHLVELKTIRPLVSLAESETLLAEGVERLARVLEEHGARPMPTSMHPFFDPKTAVRWSRSGKRVYDTYARLFPTDTHGWANVQSMQVNLPLGREHEAVAMMNAAALLVPYLPAIAASSPMYDGALQPAVDNRLAFILEHQARLPESQGVTVPEYVQSLVAYRRDILRPIYKAVDALPDAGAIRHEWLNARGAVFKLSRRSMEVRVIDSQECPKMDVAVAAYVRGALHDLSVDLTRGRLTLPDHNLLVQDLAACVQHGSRARVHAPHVPGLDRDADGLAAVADVTERMLVRAERRLKRAERPYLELIDGIRTHGTLSERIRAKVEAATDPTATTREIYKELCGCLRHNRPWRGRQEPAG
ncbi:MAG: RimK-like ATPgrasp N-terminal domain-containing protein [Sandaracinaceae bacterium]|nr:RimK-like ATPgrasp N-terminal domain-containing protein [Sandaracinaceae bacterium]